MKTINLKLIILSAVSVIVFSSCGQSQEGAGEDKNAVVTVIQNRKSVREYIPNRPVSDEDLETIIKAGMAAPSGRDIRPWEIVVIDDKKILEDIASKIPTSQMVSKAPLALVVCGDSSKSFYWYLDCSAVTQNILLACESLGLGAVWAASYPYEDRMKIVSENLNLPSHILPLAVIPVGYPAKKQMPKDKYDEAKIHRNRWSEK